MVCPKAMHFKPILGMGMLVSELPAIFPNSTLFHSVDQEVVCA
jgi:hypothetical protein